MTATLTPDATRLFAALAAGEDTPDRLCPVIADALEEAGHPLADVVRLVLPGALRWLAPEGGAVRRPGCNPRLCRYWTVDLDDLDVESSSDLPHVLYERVARRHHPTAAAAYLALAEVLSPLLPWWDRRPLPSDGRLIWVRSDTAKHPHTLPRPAFGRLRGWVRGPAPDQRYGCGLRVYPTQRDALLALLAAVTPAAKS